MGIARKNNAQIGEARQVVGRSSPRQGGKGETKGKRRGLEDRGIKRRTTSHLRKGN